MTNAFSKLLIIQDHTPHAILLSRATRNRYMTTEMMAEGIYNAHRLSNSLPSSVYGHALLANALNV